MQFKTYPNKNKPIFFYLHGECLSAFSFKEELRELKKDFTIVLPIMDGHDSESDKDFIDINDCAEKILNHIDKEYDGHIQVLAGFSMGGQIAISMLSKRPDLCEYAMIESARMTPVKLRNWSAYASVYTNVLARKKWFNKFMYYTIFNDDFAYEDYNRNYQRMSAANLSRILQSTYTYHLPDGLDQVSCKMAILVGQREKKIMKKSADLLKEALPDAQIFMLMNYTHGDFSLGNPNEYIRFVKSWIQKKDMQQRKKVEKKKKAEEGEYLPNWKHILNKIKAKKEKRQLQKTNN